MIDTEKLNTEHTEFSTGIRPRLWRENIPAGEKTARGTVLVRMSM